MTIRMLTSIADVLRAADLKVVEIPGWKERSRPASTGAFDPVGILWHHTGGSSSAGKDYAEWMFLDGRPQEGLPAPLCQVSVGGDGTWYVGAAGRANHAGEARSSGTVAAGDGNRLYLGVECMNNGSEGWRPAQYDSMVRGGAALGRNLIKCSINAQRAHKETSITGKWDPGLLDMDRFRADLGRAYAELGKDDNEVAKANVYQVNKALEASRAELRRALLLLQDVPEERVAARGLLDEIRAARRQVRELAERMPDE